ncbi:unnamed protein product [Protopolystoma xenopodis]|uniref:MHD domain-containing protein n=1 Tax=Protopolystoma xenopodis TaxID=117903 RepID=A0A3S5CSL1_9PLAT|nr:unnamed protein product [Protopolystoma xenopodis]
MLIAKAQFKRRSTANMVEINVPVPSDVDSPRFKTTVGSCKYVPETSVVIWSIKSFPGGKEFVMRASFGLPSVESTAYVESKPPITVKFEIPYFTVSGLQEIFALSDFMLLRRRPVKEMPKICKLGNPIADIKTKMV